MMTNVSLEKHIVFLMMVEVSAEQKITM